MPELLEIEAYRTLFEERGLGRRIDSVHAPDPWYLKGGLGARAVADALVGRWFIRARRHGKLLLADTDGGPTIGLRFGMTGRLLVDEAQAFDHLEYGSNRAETAWDRFGVDFDDGGGLRVRDPRRLGGVLFEPDTDALGPDAADITVAELRAVIEASRAPLKALLMNQARVAGLGNLLVDDILWRAGVDPARPARSLSGAETRTLHRAMRQSLRTLGRRGGSHTGDLQPERRRGGMCPRDGTPLQRRTVGGRTTWSCPAHQG